MSEENTTETTVETNEATGARRETGVAEAKKGLTIRELILTAILLAAGAVLKFFVGSVVNFFGMKPNFIIAMYCMAIVLIRPRVFEAIIIGIIAGAICQFFPGTPYLNFLSEFFGALVMCLLIKIPMPKIGGKVDLMPLLATFLSTIVSGGIFATFLMVVIKSDPAALAAFVPIVFFTAVFNAIIVQVLYYPLKKTLK
ncbi:MAG: hypothetical protein MJ181_09850 [Treponema sp.]|nr:hypothetical protein [Treponema sp.]